MHPFKLDELKEDPDLKDLIAISNEDYTDLKKDIEENGLKQPIIVAKDGTILDGYTRYKILKELGKELKPNWTRIQKITDPILYAIRVNLRRRHLNEFQKVELGRKLLELEHERAQDGQKLGTAAPNEAKIAKAFGMSTTTFERALAVRDSNDESLIEQLRKGKVSVSKAYYHLLEKLSKEPATLSVFERVEQLLSPEKCPTCGKRVYWTCPEGHTATTAPSVERPGIAGTVGVGA